MTKLLSAAGVAPKNMSKKREREPDKAEPVLETKVNVKPHLRCPCCWNGYGGTAKRRKWQRQVSGPTCDRCYLCGECGTEWVIRTRTEVEDGIEYRTTEVIQVRPTEEGQKAKEENERKK